MAEDITHSAGLAIIYNNKILLAHPTGNKYWLTYSIPKGRIDSGEKALQAAIRETKEEVGIKVPKELINKKKYKIEYKNKKGKIYKIVKYYLVKIKKLSDLNLSTEIIDKSNLQLDEVDWAGFIPLKEAVKRINPKLLSILDHLSISESLKYSIETFKNFSNRLNS